MKDNAEHTGGRAGSVGTHAEAHLEVGETGREGPVLEAVVSLVDCLLDDFDVVELLTELTERCTELFDVASAGLLLADPRGQLHLLAATSKRIHDLELFQLERDEGPCVDSHATGEPVNVADLRAEINRWPQFVPAATKAGVAAVHAVPMRAAGTVIGALGLFGARIGGLSPADLLVGRTLAHIATVAILQERGHALETVFPRLRTAMTNRVVVEQAAGFLHERMNVSTSEAFRLLRSHARKSGEHLTEVARAMVSDQAARGHILAGIRQTMSAERN